jgi:hypothetical protein
MLKTIDRLMAFIENSELSARQFDLSIGASNGYILRMKKNNASIGSDVIENIIKTYPQLNIIWLLTGKGQMLNQPETPEFNDFDEIPLSRQREIERIIEEKIRERQDEERKRLLREVSKEIELAQKKMHRKTK